MPEPAIGEERTISSFGTNFRMDVSATLEPDCDGDGLGDETRTGLIGGTCPQRTLSLNVNKHKVKKGKKVELSGEVAQVGGQQTRCVWPISRSSR